MSSLFVRRSWVGGVLMAAATQCLAGVTFLSVTSNAGNQHTEMVLGANAAAAEASLRERVKSFPEYSDGNFQVRALPLRSGGLTCPSGMVYAFVTTLGQRQVPGDIQRFDLALGYACGRTLEATVALAMAMCKESPACLSRPRGNEPSHLVVLLSDREEELSNDSSKAIQCRYSPRETNVPRWGYQEMEKDEAYCRTLNK